MKSWIGFGALVLAGVFLFAGLLVWIDLTLNEKRCERWATVMEVPHRWEGFYGGCYIEIDGNWIPLRSYRVIDE